MLPLIGYFIQAHQRQNQQASANVSIPDSTSPRSPHLTCRLRLVTYWYPIMNLKRKYAAPLSGGSISALPFVDQPPLTLHSASLSGNSYPTSDRRCFWSSSPDKEEAPTARITAVRCTRRSSLGRKGVQDKARYGLIPLVHTFDHAFCQGDGMDVCFANTIPW